LGAAAAGAGEAMNQVNQVVDKAAYNAGGAVTDQLAGVVPPEVAAGAGFVTNVGTQAIPTVVGGLLGKSTAPTMEKGGKWVMQTAVKPTYQELKSGSAGKAIDTLLKEGVNPTKGGMDKLRGMVDDLGDEVKAAIGGSSATVKKSMVGKTLQETYDDFSKQVNPDADIAAIRKAWLEFRNHPMLKGKSEIPVQLAQEMKQGTYKQLDKKYGQLSSAEVEAQKALARGLKDGIADAVPGVAGKNERMSELINALEVGERRALMQLNNNPNGLALLAHDPRTWAAFMADKSALFKSVMARLMYSGSGVIPTTAGAAAGGLYGAEQGSPDGVKGLLYQR
jgi:hypothetical protein